jgi:hypothetical protein
MRRSVPRSVFASIALLGCSRSGSVAPPTKRAADPVSAPDVVDVRARTPVDAGETNLVSWAVLATGAMCPEPATRGDRLAIAVATESSESWELFTLRATESRRDKGPEGGIEICDMAIDGEETWVVHGGVQVPDTRHSVVYKFDATGARSTFARRDGRTLRHIAVDAASVYVTSGESADIEVFDKKTAKLRSTLRGGPNRFAFCLTQTADELIMGQCDYTPVLSFRREAERAKREWTVEETETVAKSSCSVRAIRKSGGAARTVVDRIGIPYDLRVDGANLYVADGGVQRVFRVPLAGGPPVVVAEDGGRVTSVDVDEDWVFFTAGDAVKAVRKSGTSPIVELAGELPSAHAVRVNGRDLFVRTGVETATYDSPPELPILVPWGRGKEPNKLLRTDKGALLARSRGKAL